MKQLNVIIGHFFTFRSILDENGHLTHDTIFDHSRAKSMIHNSTCCRSGERVMKWHSGFSVTFPTSTHKGFLLLKIKPVCMLQPLMYNSSDDLKTVPYSTFKNGAKETL